MTTPIIITLVCSGALNILPHFVAAWPALAKGETLIALLINLISGNWGSAKNAVVDQQDVETKLPKP